MNLQSIGFIFTEQEKYPEEKPYFRIFLGVLLGLHRIPYSPVYLGE